MMVFSIRSSRVKGKIFLPLILLFIILFITQTTKADELTMKSVGRVNLEKLTESHPLSRRISLLEKRIEHYNKQNFQEERLLKLEDEILERVKTFSEQSYRRSEFIIENYNQQIERREEIAETEKENLRQELENEKDDKLATAIESKQEEADQAIKAAERYYTAELKNEKQEIIRDYNREISRLRLAIRFSELSVDESEERLERLVKLEETRNSELETLEVEYEEKLTKYIEEKEAEVSEYKKEQQDELEQEYQQKYEKRAQEIIAAKNKDINLLEKELEEKLADELVEIEAEIDDDLFADEIINKIKDKDRQSLEQLESLEKKLARLEEEKEAEISQLIEKYKTKYNLDLVISGQLPRVSAHDLTKEIKSEWSVVSE